MKINIHNLFLVFLLLLLFFCTSLTSAGEINSADFSNAKDHWTFLGGYGVTHPGFGDTETRVETADFILQYGYFLSEEIGTSWYKGRHEILIELPFSYVFQPDDGIMTGVNFLACWDFTASKKVVPYIFAGGGLVYTDTDIQGLGSDFNGNYQGGLGVHYLLNKNTTIDFNYRLHHISNASTAEPNEPLNSSKFLIGVSFLK